MVKYEDIIQYADLLYEEKYEDKIKGARNSLTLIKEAAIMFTIITENENIFDILSRTLRDENKKIIPGRANYYYDEDDFDYDDGGYEDAYQYN